MQTIDSWLKHFCRDCGWSIAFAPLAAFLGNDSNFNLTFSFFANYRSCTGTWQINCLLIFGTGLGELFWLGIFPSL